MIEVAIWGGSRTGGTSTFLPLLTRAMCPCLVVGMGEVGMMVVVVGVYGVKKHKQQQTDVVCVAI